MSAAPAQVILAQLAAYNARDLEAFVACYADDVECYDLTQPDGSANATRLVGIEAFRARYATQFTAQPLQRAEVLHRHVMGELCFDLERITGVYEDGPRREREPFTVMVIYRVRANAEGDQRIDRVWFSPRGTA